jgi:hypothetical protein
MRTAWFSAAVYKEIFVKVNFSETLARIRLLLKACEWRLCVYIICVGCTLDDMFVYDSALPILVNRIPAIGS